MAGKTAYAMRGILQFFFIAMTIRMANGQMSLFMMEAEDGVTPGLSVMHRSRASNGRSVSLVRNQVLQIWFCLSKASTFSLKTIEWSNDGDSDKVLIHVDGRHAGELVTSGIHHNGGGWNVFHSSSLNFEKTLLAGRHILTLTALDTDMFGMEIDALQIGVDDEDMTIDGLLCKVFCFPDIKYESLDIVDVIPSAKLVQNSTRTSCAEHDNINIPIFHENPKHFSITASLPKYISFVNARGADWYNCKMALYLFEIHNLAVKTDSRVDKPNIVLTISENGGFWEISAIFPLDGPSKAAAASELGSNMLLIFENLLEPMEVDMQYFGRLQKWSEPERRTIFPGPHDNSWNVSDYTWIDGAGNSIYLSFVTKQKDLNIKYFRLQQRTQEPDRPFRIYDDANTVIEGVDIDFWWLRGQTMTVRRLDTGEEFIKADYIRIYKNIPWSKDDFSQVFVMYQDGNVRLLPITPHGLDWIPFGSSVLIGDADQRDPRPYAPIKSIDIDPHTLSLKIKYANMGSAILDIRTTFTETEIIVRNFESGQNRATHPFLTFRSMWLTDGNADVDRVSVNAVNEYSVISDWKELFGTSVAFYRKCISKHNTLSPDIRVTMLSPTAV